MSVSKYEKKENREIQLEELSVLQLQWPIRLKEKIKFVFCQKHLVYVQSESQKVFVVGSDPMNNGVLGLGKSLKETSVFQEIPVFEAVVLFSATEKYCLALTSDEAVVCWGNLVNVGGKLSLIPKELYFLPKRLNLQIGANQIFTTNFSFYFVLEKEQRILFCGNLLKFNSDEDGKEFSFDFARIFSISTVGVLYFKSLKTVDLFFLNNKNATHSLIQNCNFEALNFQNEMLVYFNFEVGVVNLFDFFKYSERAFNHSIINVPVQPHQFILPTVQNSDGLLSIQFMLRDKYECRKLGCLGLKGGVLRDPLVRLNTGEFEDRTTKETEFKLGKTKKQTIKMGSNVQINKSPCQFKSYPGVFINKEIEGNLISQFRNGQVSCQEKESEKVNSFLDKIHSLQENFQLCLGQTKSNDGRIQNIRKRLDDFQKNKIVKNQQDKLWIESNQFHSFKAEKENNILKRKNDFLIFRHIEELILMNTKQFGLNEIRNFSRLKKALLSMVLNIEKRFFLSVIDSVSNFKLKKTKIKSRFFQFLNLFFRKRKLGLGFENISSKYFYFLTKQKKSKILKSFFNKIKIKQKEKIEWTLWVFNKWFLDKVKLFKVLSNLFLRKHFSKFYLHLFEYFTKKIDSQKTKLSQLSSSQNINKPFSEDLKPSTSIDFLYKKLQNDPKKSLFQKLDPIISKIKENSLKLQNNQKLTSKINKGLFESDPFIKQEKKDKNWEYPNSQNLSKNQKIKEVGNLNLESREDLLEASQLLLEQWRNESSIKLESSWNPTDNYHEKEFRKYCQEIFNLKQEEDVSKPIDQSSNLNQTQQNQMQEDPKYSQLNLISASFLLREAIPKNELENSKLQNSRRNNNSEMEESIDKEVKLIMEKYDAEQSSFHLTESPRKNPFTGPYSSLIQIEDQMPFEKKTVGSFVFDSARNMPLQNSTNVNSILQSSAFLAENFVGNLQIIREENSGIENTQLSFSKNISGLILEQKIELPVKPENSANKNLIFNFPIIYESISEKNERVVPIIFQSVLEQLKTPKKHNSEANSPRLNLNQDKKNLSNSILVNFHQKLKQLTKKPVLIFKEPQLKTLKAFEKCVKKECKKSTFTLQKSKPNTEGNSEMEKKSSGQIRAKTFENYRKKSNQTNIFLKINPIKSKITRKKSAFNIFYNENRSERNLRELSLKSYKSIGIFKATSQPRKSNYPSNKSEGKNFGADLKHEGKTGNVPVFNVKNLFASKDKKEEKREWLKEKETTKRKFELFVKGL